MLKKGEKTTYYISNVGTCSLSVIDGSNFSRLKEIKVDARPQKIVVDDRNNVFIACDRNNRITCIHNSNSVNQTWDIPNNGNLQVDSHVQRIYACNAEEISIYSLENGEMITTIKGFTAVDCLRLDNQKKRLFVLDILEKVIKVFSTESYKLLRTYKNIGAAPSDFIIDLGDRYLYVANKGIKSKKYSGNVSIVDIISGNISYINLKQEAVITTLVQGGVYLYAANNEHHQIEVIDLSNKQCIASIKTTLPFIKRLRISPDCDTLLAISLDQGGNGVIDRIDIDKNVIINTFFRGEKGTPYDIGIVIQGESKVEAAFIDGLGKENKWDICDYEVEDRKKKEDRKRKEDRKILEDNKKIEDCLKRNVVDKEDLWDNENKLMRQSKQNNEHRWNSVNRWNKENGMNILTKEVISSYQEKVIFPEVTIEIGSEEIDLINANEVIFQKCIMNSDSINRRTIMNRKEYSILQYDFHIPYYISYKERQEKTYALKGKIEGTQIVTLFLPIVTEQLGVEFVVNASTKLISPPIFEDNLIKFEVSALISTLVVVDKTVFIPFFEG